MNIHFGGISNPRLEEKKGILRKHVTEVTVQVTLSDDESGPDWSTFSSITGGASDTITLTANKKGAFINETPLKTLSGSQIPFLCRRLIQNLLKLGHLNPEIHKEHIDLLDKTFSQVD